MAYLQQCAQGQLCLYSLSRVYRRLVSVTTILTKSCEFSEGQKTISETIEQQLKESICQITTNFNIDFDLENLGKGKEIAVSMCRHTTFVQHDLLLTNA